MTTTMTSDIEQQLLELVANAVGFEYMMYVPICILPLSGQLYNRVHAHMSEWNPRVDDGDLFRMAVAAQSVNLHRIIDSSSGAGQQNLEIRCGYVRESFVQAVVNAVVDSLSGRGSRSVSETSDAGECQK
jgi:hypothetical protein